MLLASFLWTPATLPKLPLCWFRSLWGVSCPGCGLSRAFCAISHGDLGAAWGFHPFGFAFYATALALVAWPVAVQARPELEARLLRARGGGAVVVVFVVALLAFGVVRAWGELAAG